MCDCALQTGDYDLRYTTAPTLSDIEGENSVTQGDFGWRRAFRCKGCGSLVILKNTSTWMDNSKICVPTLLCPPEHDDFGLRLSTPIPYVQ